MRFDYFETNVNNKNIRHKQSYQTDRDTEGWQRRHKGFIFPFKIQDSKKVYTFALGTWYFNSDDIRIFTLININTKSTGACLFDTTNCFVTLFLILSSSISAKFLSSCSEIYTILSPKKVDFGLYEFVFLPLMPV